MNCHPYLGSVASPQLRPSNNPKTITEFGIDLNPYLNFLLDLNTLNLAGTGAGIGSGKVPLNNIGQIPPTSNTSNSLSRNSIPTNFSRKKSKLHFLVHARTPVRPCETTSTLSTKEITSRLDRLEGKLSKIVNSVVNRRSSHSPRSPHSATDEEENVSILSESSAFQLLSRKNQSQDLKSWSFRSKIDRQKKGRGNQRNLMLLLPESFEENEPDILTNRIRSNKSTAKVENNLRKSVSKARLEREVKSEKEGRQKLEIELSNSQAEIQKLKTQFEFAKDETSEIRDQNQKLKTSLGEESQRREKAEKSLQIHIKLASCLNAKIQTIQEREQKLRTSLTTKEAALTTLTFMQRENVGLKSEIQNLVTAKKIVANHEPDRRALNDAMKKATCKFTKFHKDEIRRFESQLRTSQEIIHDLEEQLGVAAGKEGELAQLRAVCSGLELRMKARKSREEVQERRVAELIDRAANTEEIVRGKDEELEKLHNVIVCLKKELDRLKNTLAELHAEKTNLRNLRDTKTNKTEEKCEKLEQEKTNLQEKLEKLDEERTALRSKLKESEDTVKTLKDEHQLELTTREETAEKSKTDLAILMERSKIKEKITEDLQETIQKLQKSIEYSSQKAFSPSADTEHFKRRNRELEEVLERLENRKEDLKNQIFSTESQLQESNKAHEIIYAKWKEKSVFVTRLQFQFSNQQIHFQVKEEELTKERDEAQERVQSLEKKVEELKIRSRQLRQNDVDVQNLKTKFEEKLAKKDIFSAKIQQQNQELEIRLKELTEEFSSQKKQISGKFTRLGKFLQDFENDF